MLRQCVGIKGSRNANGHSSQSRLNSAAEWKKTKDAAKLLLFAHVVVSQVNGRSCGEMEDRTSLGFSPPFNLYLIGFPLPGSL